MILNDFSVDDLLSGVDTLEEACVFQDNLIETLNKNCFPLRKWSSNEPQLVICLPKHLQEDIKAYEINDKDHQIKTPGLMWYPLGDHFVHACCSEYVSAITKRSLLSDVSKHFDPIGLIAPVVVVAKVIIQSCWKLDLEWKDAVPDDVSRAYTNWKDDMCSLSQFNIPRKVPQTHLHFEETLCKSSVMLLKRHIVLMSIWCQSKMTSSPQPPFLQMQRGSDQHLKSSSSRAPSNTHWCQTCNSGQGGTIKIEAGSQLLSVVLRLNDCPLMDEGRLRSMAHICLKPCLSNSVDVAKN